MKMPKLGSHITVTLYNGSTWTGGVTRWPRGGSTAPVCLDHKQIGPRYAVESWVPATDSEPLEEYRFVGHIYQPGGRLVWTVLGATQQVTASRVADFFVRQRSDASEQSVARHLSTVALGECVTHATGWVFQLTALT